MHNDSITMPSPAQDHISPDPVRTRTWKDWLGWLADWQGLMLQWLTTRGAADWYAQQTRQLASAEGGAPLLNPLFRALGQAPRKTGRQDLALSPAEQRAAEGMCPGFDASRWSIDQAARIGLILAVASRLPDSRAFADLLDELASQGDIQEQIALYQGFALFPHDPVLLARAGEAIRSGMRPVFAAFALRNPWPQAMLAPPIWNQMIVKTFFLDLPVWPIQGLAERANADLSVILCDLIAERTAAGRGLNPEIWRLLALCPAEPGHRLLLQQLGANNADERLMQALRLAVQESPHASLRAAAGRQDAPQAFDMAEWAQFAQWQE